MKLEFAHLDCPWVILNYQPKTRTNSSIFYALTNIGILLYSNWNKILSSGKRGVKGYDLIDYVYKSPVELLFNRQLNFSGSQRSGCLRGGTKSPYYKFYNYNNLNLIKKGILERLQFNKIYFRDKELYHIGDGIFEDAKKIDPLFAASFSEIREVKYSIVSKDRSQARDRFTQADYKELFFGKIVLKKPEEECSVVPEYALYLKIDRTKSINYITEEKAMKEKIMFKLKNKIRSNGREKRIHQIFNSYKKRKCLNVIEIMIRLNELGENLDLTSVSNKRNVLKSLRLLVKKGLYGKNKKEQYYKKIKFEKSSSKIISEKIKSDIAETSSSETIKSDSSTLKQQLREVIDQILQKL